LDVGAEGERMAVRMRDLTKVYQVGETEIHALAGVDLEIPCGQFVSIMGPSGSGKSTLLNVMGCIDTPTSGSRNLCTTIRTNTTVRRRKATEIS